MDNSWQIKCSSTWHPSMPSSSQLPPQGPRNQTEANGIQSFHPFSAHEFSLTDNGVIHEPMVLNNMDLSSSHSGKPDMANSFLALLSGSSPQLQCEFQLLSSSRSAMAATKLPEHDSNIAVSSAGFGVPITPIMAFNQLQGNGNMGNAAEFCPIVPSRAASTTNYGCPSPSYLRDNFQLANSNLQSSDYAKTGFDHAVCSNERGMNLRQGCPSANPGNSCLFNKTTIQSSPKFPSESKAVMLDSSSTFTRGHPLVFCLGKTGNLLLSNTGLLGVVCSCHNLHMSIAKFCGHSGLRTVNPGDAVCLESGETVAQWRRLYFHKLGIRVPDEHSEWDWPEEFSATGGLVKCRATVPNMSIKSDMFLPVDSVGGITRCGQTRNSFVSSRNPRTGQSVVEKSANTILHNAWQKNAQEGHNLVFNSLIGTSNSILPALAADGQILKENPMSRGLPLSNTAVNVGGQDSGYRSISDYVDLLKAGNLLTSDPSLESSKSLGIPSDVRRCNNSLEGFVVGREAISSNIELRLGQPSQHSNTMGGSILSTEGPQPFNTLGDSQKAPYQGHVIHNMVNPWVTEGSRQNIYCMPLDTSNFNLREAESQLNFRNHALGNDNARDAVELSKGDADKNSLISTFLQHFRPPSYGAIQSQTANDMVNSVEHFLPRVPGGGSHVSKRNPTNLTWSRSDGTQKQLNSHWLGLHNHTDKGKGVILADNHPKFSVEGSSTFQGKHTADSSLFDGVIGGYCLPSSSAVLCSSYLGQSPGVLPDANKPSNPNGRVSFPRRDGQHDHAFLRSVHSFPVSAGPGIPLSTTSMGFSSATSISRPSPTPCLSSKEGSDVNQQLLDENLRLLLLRHMVELSKQEHGMAFQEMNPEQGRLHTPSGMGVQRKCSFQDPLTSEQIREGIYLTIKQDASEVKSLQSCSNCGLPGGIEKPADLAGTNSRSNFSTVAMQGSTLCSKDLGIQCLPSHDTVMHTNPLLRLGRIENNNIAASGDHAKCFHKELHTYFPEKCSCCVHSMCLAGSVSRGESSLGAYKEHIGSVDGKNSLLVASAFDKANVISQEKAVALGQCKNVKRQISVNEDCNDTQWNDVSCRVMGVRNGTCIRMPAEELDGRENVDQFLETASKGYIGASQEAELLKEQQMSNICSGCSAPAITEVSIEVNNMDSCTVDAGYVTDHIVDEGSGVEKCWSSDDALDSGRSAHTPIVTTKVDSTMGGSLVLPTQSSNADEIKMRNPLRLKKVSNKHTSGCAVHDNINHMKHFEKDLKTGKKKKAMKWKSLDASFPPSGLSSVQFKLPKCAGRTELQSCSSKEMHFSSQLPSCGKHTSGSSSLKRKHSSMSSSKTLTQKRSRQGLDVHHRESEDDNQTQLKENSNLIEVPKLSGTKKAKWAGCENVSTLFQRQDMSHVETDKAAKYSSVECMKSLSSPHVDTCDKKKAKPIICGNSGIIFNEKLAEGLGKPPKIVALSVILKKAGRCTISENEKLALISMLETKKSKLRSKGCNSKVSVLKKERDNESKKTVINDDLGHGISMTETKKTCFSRNEDWVEELSMLQKEEDDEGHTERGDLRRLSSALGKPRFKETRRRSLYELTRRGKNPGSTKFCHTKVSKCTLQTKCRSYGELHLTDAEGSQERTGELGQVDAKKSIKDHNYLASVSESNAFCCVCGSSNKDEMNYLLECGRCYIRVHQACYGVTKVPKGCWSCRPCRTSSEHIVCVLCGYEGGAMTRAIRSRSAVKSLLKAWDTSNISKSGNSNLLSKTLQDESGPLDALTSVNEADLVSTVRLKNSKPFPIAVLKMDLQNQMDDVNAKDGPSSNPRVHNTVTAGVLDPTIMQWVHMVCGLWTPGTRCPNVDTMSAFDVSGAQGSRKTIVCSMCYRPGGSCIQCRVANCSVQFHPWCAHQKGLLQSEVEGVDNEKVGFYGRCEIHATHYKCVREDHHVDTRTESPEQKDTTCARTEGYKGRRRDGFIHNHHGQSSDNGGCLVPQEQINAWLHINGQKSSTRGFLKPPASDVEYDCRVLSSCQKEYARYKQAKGWKHLVVYKSGIHALGLYTSRFISRGSMVVEYVGEIVGLRVADKRENDYQSGRKLQYKSACYFFRIDKEHIIDATRKGGIARFVNHSCLPNCVAKVISVRNEKKVVFFAERDINPGEEITYDYHFNHEDEGKKIPCFCNSKNCRRYLN